MVVLPTFSFEQPYSSKPHAFVYQTPFKTHQILHFQSQALATFKQTEQGQCLTLFLLPNTALSLLAFEVYAHLTLHLPLQFKTTSVNHHSADLHRRNPPESRLHLNGQVPSRIQMAKFQRRKRVGIHFDFHCLLHRCSNCMCMSLLLEVAS